MGILWILAIPVLCGAAATWKGLLALKMGVPLTCAAIIALFALPGSVTPITEWLVIGALGVSAVGDYFLSNKGERNSYFVVGIGLYLVAHAGYLSAAWLDSRVNPPLLVALLVVFGAYYLTMLRPSIARLSLRAAVLIYLIVSCLVLAIAWNVAWPGAPRVLYAAGIALIVFSDTAISIKEFLKRPWASRLILPTYYLAHVSLTAALLLR